MMVVTTDLGGRNFFLFHRSRIFPTFIGRRASMVVVFVSTVRFPLFLVPSFLWSLGSDGGAGAARQARAGLRPVPNSAAVAARATLQRHQPRRRWAFYSTSDVLLQILSECHELVSRLFLPFLADSSARREVAAHLDDITLQCT